MADTEIRRSRRDNTNKCYVKMMMNNLKRQGLKYGSFWRLTPDRYMYIALFLSITDCGDLL